MSLEYVAARPHRRPCDLCGEPIVPGQSCEKWTYFQRHDPPMEIRVHQSCRDEAKQYEWYTDSDGWPEEFPLIEERRNVARVRPTPTEVPE